MANRIDVRKIMTILPHRYPMLLHRSDRRTRTAEIRARLQERDRQRTDVRRATFPGQPRAARRVHGRSAGATCRHDRCCSPGDMARKLVYLVGIDKSEIPPRRSMPGDRLRHGSSQRSRKTKRNMGFVTVEATVEGKLACSGELMFSIGVDVTSASSTLKRRSSSTVIHPTAIVHPVGAHRQPTLKIGPYCIVGEHVSLGARTTLLAHVDRQRPHHARRGRDRASVRLGRRVVARSQSRPMISRTRRSATARSFASMHRSIARPATVNHDHDRRRLPVARLHARRAQLLARQRRHDVESRADRGPGRG